MTTQKPYDGPNGRKPHPVDIHVGSRLRYRRMIIGMSQEKLGEKINLTFQQIQKYERGDNRIAASRLFQISKILEVPVGYFFEGYPGFEETDANVAIPPNIEFALTKHIQNRDGIDLNLAFAAISSPKVRRCIIDLVRSFGEEEEVVPAGAVMAPVIQEGDPCPVAGCPGHFIRDSAAHPTGNGDFLRCDTCCLPDFEAEESWSPVGKVAKRVCAVVKERVGS